MGLKWSTPDKSIFDFDFEIFFQDGGWRDMIKGEAPMLGQGETQMALTIWEISK